MPNTIVSKKDFTVLDANPEVNFLSLLSNEQVRLYLSGPTSVSHFSLKRLILSLAHTLPTDLKPFLNSYLKCLRVSSVLARLWFKNIVLGAEIEG